MSENWRFVNHLVHWSVKSILIYSKKKAKRIKRIKNKKHSIIIDIVQLLQQDRFTFFSAYYLLYRREQYAVMNNYIYGNLVNISTQALKFRHENR